MLHAEVKYWQLIAMLKKLPGGMRSLDTVAKETLLHFFGLDDKTDIGMGAEYLKLVERVELADLEEKLSEKELRKLRDRLALASLEELLDEGDDEGSAKLPFPELLRRVQAKEKKSRAKEKLQEEVKS